MGGDDRHFFNVWKASSCVVPHVQGGLLVVFFDVVFDLVVEGMRSVKGLAILEKSCMNFL